MKALSVRQPWAGLIAGGIKTLEIRSRPTHYRGELLICASLGRPAPLQPAHARLPIAHLLVRGMALCIVRLSSCRPFLHADVVAAGGVPHDPALFAWEFTDARLITPFPVKGALSFFTVCLPT